MKHKKDAFSEWFSEILQDAELSDMRYNVKGFIVYRPWSVLAIKQMYRLFEKELEQKGHKPAIFPSVIPEENFSLEATHVEGFVPQVLWVTHGGKEELEARFALRPTSETAMYKMYSLWIRSWRDLPLKIYQSCQVWRHETKATRPFIRGREFHWIEAHDAFATRKDAEDQVNQDMQMTENVMHQIFGVPFIFMKRPEWDKFPGAVHTFAADTIMPDGKILQQPSTHLLGQNFSKPFGVKYEDANGGTEFVWQTCYGPAISRIFASVVATHGDDRGLVFPWDIAPAQIVIIPILKGKDNDKVLKKAKDLSCCLAEKYRIELDTSDNTIGWKFNQWEMKGVPIRIELGPKEMDEKKLTLSRRDNGDKITILEKDLERMLEKLGREITENLVQNADKSFKSNIRTAKDFKELQKELEKGGLIKADFCTMEKPGEKCAEEIKNKLHGDVRGSRVDKKEKPTGNCVICGKKAQDVVYIGKAY